VNTSTTLTAGELCDIRGPARNEVVRLTAASAPSDGVQSVTALMAFSHTTGSPYQCGGAVGNYLAMTDYEPANSAPGSGATPQIYYEQVYGSTGPNTLIVGDRTAGQFESLFPTTGTVNVSMVQGADVMGVLDPTTTTITVAAGSATGTVGSCATFAGKTVTIPGAGAATYSVASCSGTSITLRQAVASTVTAATMSHVPDGTFIATMPPPSTAFGAGHHVLNANNISALVTFTGHNSFFNNPWMWRIEDSDNVFGLGGGMMPSQNVRHFYLNTQADTNYLGATGKYYAPAWAALVGPVRNMISMDHWPVDPDGSVIENNVPGCGRTLLCIALGFSAHDANTDGVIFRDHLTGTDLVYTPSTGMFGVTRSGAHKVNFGVNGYAGFGLNIGSGDNYIAPPTPSYSVALVGDDPPSTGSSRVQVYGWAAAGHLAGRVVINGTNAQGLGIVVDSQVGGEVGGVGVGYGPTAGILPPGLSTPTGIPASFGCTGSTTSTCPGTVDGNGNASFPTYTGPATAPSGPCSTSGVWVFSQDGHATFCAAGTWTTKI
jgi:hypothetical protein